MKLAKLVLPFPKLGSCETTTPGREHEDGPRRQRRRRRRTGLVGVRASAGKSQKKTHPEKAKKKKKKTNFVFKIIIIKAMIEGQLEG